MSLSAGKKTFILAVVGFAVGGLIAHQIWKKHPPTLRVYSGAAMRRPMEVLVKQFQAEHNVQIDTVYNGCGILVSQMKTGAEGDVYYSCDTFFMNEARQIGAMDESYPIANVTRFRPVIMVQKGNPLDIKSVEDLAQKGLKLGMGAEMHGAVGHTGWAIIRSSPKFAEIEKNIKVTDPTADFLATQLVTGHLDAAILWDAVATNYAEKADRVPILGWVATQPIGLMKKAKNVELAREFIEFVRSPGARKVFADYGFIVDGPTSQP